MKKLLCVALTLVMLISSVSAFAATQKVVTVNNMQDMVSAIASNTKIIIEAGNYVATAGRDVWGNRTGIRIENIENLTIEAKGDVEIKLNIGYCPVFEVENSKNITFIGLSLGHDVPKGSCEGQGDVISVFNSQNINIDICDLWGCGIVGIWAQDSGNINVTNTTIRDCENSAVACYTPKGSMVLDNCKVLRNNYGAEGEASEWDVCFRWSPNAADDVKLTVKNSVIEGNYSGKLLDDQYYDKAEPSNKVEFLNCTIKNNAWDNAEKEAPVEQEPEQEYVEPEIYEPAPELPPEEYYDEPERYNKNVFTVNGITGYDESRQVMYDNTVALCTAPVTITANKNLSHMAIVKLEKVNGEWVEKRYFEGFAINLGDVTKNWMPAEGFEYVDEDYYEFTGNQDFFGSEPVKKGTSISFSEKGMYQVWADAEDGEYTGLTFEIKDATAAYTDSKVLVDGKQIKFEAYNINDNNYFKLRDIAFALTNHGTGLNVFNVKWDEAKNMINLVAGEKYDAVGGELKEGDGKNKKYEISTSALMKDGRNATLTAFLINGNNYFKLRDLGKLFDFNVSWDGANNCILIDTTASYQE